MKKIASALDPLWYKDAIIYELHVRAFADSNNDGIGDFPGLLSHLDYLQDLGVSCIWLLPFFPSPLRDDGYDISNYTDVNPSYGTLHDFKAVLDSAHQRGMQVMIELVVNHTSDQHPWFKAARLALPGSPQRDMYVWSDSDQKYPDARIIFTDTEKSNWAWDETAKAYYWHRFFSRQPDLNYDNPLVLDEIIKAMRFWLDMGVDALRIDAIPYLCERDGTSCENLPETHSVVRRLRAAIDEEYANRLILAEANQWPADVRPYFGDGDECHMAFHFPLMPRIYMALRQEDRLPITDIMAQTPPIPELCQWALFLRNHDELTLEMVTDDERDYMYFAYSADPRMRINVGIRRRLAPLVDNNRRRIELLNSLLLSFPGTPILYYGDEIGMGDNIYLGDRNGVRTPMQWSSDRNAGFSKCDPARLYLPVVMDPLYGYPVVNVESQLSDPSSLLHWTRNMIALRKLFQVFGRGTLSFLNPANRKVLAYLRDLDLDGFHQTVLCVANLSRFAQPVSLDLSTFIGFIPVEMLGYVTFPVITATPYILTLAPYSFLWLELQPGEGDHVVPSKLIDQVTSQAEANSVVPVLSQSWAELLQHHWASLLEPALLKWLPQQRWYGAKTRTIESIKAHGWIELPPPSSADRNLSAESSAAKPDIVPPALFFIEVQYREDPVPDTYQILLSIGTGNVMDQIAQAYGASIIAELTTEAGPAILYEASAMEQLHQVLLQLIEDNGNIAVSTSPSLTEPNTNPSTNDSFQLDSGPSVESHQSPDVPDSLPLTAQPGEAATEPRMVSTDSSSSGLQRLQPRRSQPGVDGVPQDARLYAQPSRAFPPEWTTQTLPSRIASAEQSNTSIIYGNRFILKLFRRLQLEENPDVEIGRFLTEVAHFPGTPLFLGEISMGSAGLPGTTLAILQSMVQNHGDGWQWYVKRLSSWLAGLTGQAHAILAVPSFLDSHADTPDELRSAQATLDASALLGRRTAEMHLALSSSVNLPAFVAESLTAKDLASDAERIESQIQSVLRALKLKLATLDDTISDAAALLISRRQELIHQARGIMDDAPSGQRIRIHGDYHLGQVLRTTFDASPNNTDEGDFVIIDFEGEPNKPIQERRLKRSPLRDVAGMMRSFSYAAHAAIDQVLADRQNADYGMLVGWAQLWSKAASAQFLLSYRKTISHNPDLLPAPSAADLLLKGYLLEKAMYEVLYELNHRPQWLHIPMQGILEL